MARLPNSLDGKNLGTLRAGTPDKPGTLSPAASAAWDLLLQQFAESGLQLTKAHSTALSMAATLTADIADAWEVIQKEGAYVPNEKTGAIQAHPASKRLDALRRDYIKILSLLGLRTPVSSGPPAALDEIEQMLAED